MFARIAGKQTWKWKVNSQSPCGYLPSEYSKAMQRVHNTLALTNAQKNNEYKYSIIIYTFEFLFLLVKLD